MSENVTPSGVEYYEATERPEYRDFLMDDACIYWPRPEDPQWPLFYGVSVARWMRKQYGPLGSAAPPASLSHHQV